MLIRDLPTIIAGLLVGAPATIGIGRVVTMRFILPHLVPRADIASLAEKVIRFAPDNPEDVAFGWEYRAWAYGDLRAQGVWRRVRREIRRRRGAVSPPPASEASGGEG